MMYRLLIVDDEPVIVDGMFELFQEHYLSELEIYRAYSGKEALKLMGELRMDIVVSDIGMPRIDGFQLQQETRRMWPHSKFIFLTSHNDFHYAQTALRNGSADFILKTEEDDSIIASVRKAIAELEEDQSYQELIDQARKQLHVALPLLRRDYLTGIHDGTLPRRSISAAAFREMQISMEAEREVLPVIGRIDDWGRYEEKADQVLMMHAVENILNEFFSSHQFQFAAVGKAYFALFVQPASCERAGQPNDNQYSDGQVRESGQVDRRPGQPAQSDQTDQANHANQRDQTGQAEKTAAGDGTGAGMAERETAAAGNGGDGAAAAAKYCWERVITFVKGTLEAVQPVIQRLLRLTVSFSIAQHPSGWHELHLHFESLRRRLLHLPGNEMILTAEWQPEDKVKAANLRQHRTARNVLRQITDIELTAAAQHKQFAELIGKLKQCLDEAFDAALFAEIHLTVAAHFTACINRWEGGSAANPNALAILRQFEMNRPYSAVLDEFVRLASAFIREREQEQSRHTNQVVYLLHQFIEAHIDEELSLNRLGEVVYLNPVYLSRLYKQSTGIGLVDYINDVRLKKAKQALLATNAKIHDIARSVGFESPTYFARLFKRQEGITPQEYRERRLQ